MKKPKLKLYYRKNNNQLLRLDKKSPLLYMFIVDNLIKGGYEKFMKKNKDIRYYNNCEPLDWILNEIKDEVKNEILKLNIQDNIIYMRTSTLRIVKFI